MQVLDLGLRQLVPLRNNNNFDLSSRITTAPRHLTETISPGQVLLEEERTSPGIAAGKPLED